MKAYAQHRFGAAPIAGPAASSGAARAAGDAVVALTVSRTYVPDLNGEQWHAGAADGDSGASVYAIDAGVYTIPYSSSLSPKYGLELEFACLSDRQRLGRCSRGALP